MVGATLAHRTHPTRPTPLPVLPPRVGAMSTVNLQVRARMVSLALRPRATTGRVGRTFRNLALQLITTLPATIPAQATVPVRRTDRRLPPRVVGYPLPALLPQCRLHLRSGTLVRTVPLRLLTRGARRPFRITTVL